MKRRLTLWLVGLLVLGFALTGPVAHARSIYQCVTQIDLNTGSVLKACKWVNLGDDGVAHEGHELLNWLDSYIVGQQTPWSDPNPFPPWYSDDPDHDCPKGMFCTVYNNPFGPKDKGKVCTLYAGNGLSLNGIIWDHRLAYGQMLCTPDSDADGVPDFEDKCPHDPSDTDPDCLDELPDCPPLVQIGVLGTSVGASVAGIAVKGGIGVAFGWAGIVIAIIGGVYCIVADMENGR